MHRSQIIKRVPFRFRMATALPYQPHRPHPATRRTNRAQMSTNGTFRVSHIDYRTSLRRQRITGKPQRQFHHYVFWCLHRYPRLSHHTIAFTREHINQNRVKGEPCRHIERMIAALSVRAPIAPGRFERKLVDAERSRPHVHRCRLARRRFATFAVGDRHFISRQAFVRRRRYLDMDRQ